MTHRLLIVEDEPNYRKVLRLMLCDFDVVVEEAADGVAGLARIDAGGIDLVLCDVNMPRLGGLALLDRLHGRDANRARSARAADSTDDSGAGAPEFAPPVVIMTAYANVDDAVAALKGGAIDYLTKPFDEQRLRLTLQRALMVTSLVKENQQLANDVRDRCDFRAIVGTSPALTAALQLAAKMAPSEAPVLLQGESGTGKELFARAIHINSKRARGPFVAVNCAAIPDALLEAELFGAEAGAYTGATKKRRGRVELARGGTLFLDEIGDLDAAVQAKLLKLLEDRTVRRLGSVRERQVDLRFVAATHRPLEALVREGKFRSDLYFRLSVLGVSVPPLRERGDDILVLAEALVARTCAQMGRRPLPLTPRAQDALRRYRWPGNIRELGNVLERGVILCDGDVLDDVDLDLPPPPSAPLPPPAASSTSTTTTSAVTATAPFVLPDAGVNLEDVERDLVRQALERAKGNKSHAARLLGLTRATLRYRLEKFRLVDRGADNADS